MKRALPILAAVLAGCAAAPAMPPPARAGRAPVADMSAGQCRAEVARLQAQLAAEVAERQKQARAAARREETLRRQLDAMMSIERGILERDERIRTEAR